MTTPLNVGSSKLLYRFRPTEKLLGEKYQELENQQIYFASPEQLNDPREGHTNLYWRGDAIIWKGLFKNYIFCALNIFGLWAAFKPEDHIKGQNIPVTNPLKISHHHINLKLEAAFFGNPVIKEFLERIVAANRSIGPNEITAHLRALHYFVVFTIFDVIRKEQQTDHPELATDAPFPGIEYELGKIKAANDMLAFVQKDMSMTSEEIEFEYFRLLSAYEQTDLLNYHTQKLDLQDFNRIFMFNDFTRAYVRQLNTLMYTPWYIACFMEECTDSSMWAYYGNSHTGICLIFRTEGNNDERFIKLKTTTAYTAQGEIKTMREHYFKRVNYCDEHATLNFFESLGGAPTPILNAQWYRGENGEFSPFLLRTEEERQKWRDRYWKQYLTSATTKMKIWGAEKEQRLVHFSGLGDVGKDRTLEYDFSSLEGIIFGVRASAADKLKIISIIQKKCLENKRTDFKFYQAYFSNNSNEIKFSELDIISKTLNAG